jgi:hypothetical protein
MTALSDALDEYEATHLAPRSAAADTVLNALKDADADTARAFANIAAEFDCDHTTLVEVLLETVALRVSLDAKESELKDMLDLTRDARSAINSLRAIVPHLDNLYVDLEEDIDELERAIAEKELMTQNELEGLMLNRQKGSDDYQLRAGLRFLVERIVLYTKGEATSPDIAELATVIFGDPDDPDMMIHDERVRKVRRELAKKPGGNTPYWPY